MLDTNQQNFHSALEYRLSTSVDWTTPGNHKTVAKQETWCEFNY